MKKARYDWHIQQCQKLRVAYSNAGIDYFLGILSFENDESAWKVGVDGPTGWPTFLDCLHVSNIKMAHAYEKFKLKLEVCGDVKRLREIGLDAAEELLKVPDDVFSKERPNVPARQAVYEEFVAFRKRNNTTITGRRARSLQQRHFRPAPKISIGPVNEFDRMRVELRAKSAEIVRLQKQIAAKDAEIVKLQKSLAKLQKQQSGVKGSRSQTRSARAN